MTIASGIVIRSPLGPQTLHGGKPGLGDWGAMGAGVAKVGLGVGIGVAQAQSATKSGTD